MQYDYEGVTEVRVEPGVARIEVVAKGQTYVINGIKRIYYKSAKWTDTEKGITYLNNGRVSVNGEEAVVGD